MAMTFILKPLTHARSAVGVVLRDLKQVFSQQGKH
jgi:hypothetical protein